MSDYAVKITVRNGRILRRMQELGIASGSELARLAGINPTVVSSIVTMRERPTRRNGEWREGVERIAGVLKCDPEDLFTDAQRDNALKTNSSEVFMDEAQVMALASPDPEQSTWAKIETTRLLATLKTDRERDIVTRRFEGETADSIAHDYNLSNHRILQIEKDSLRRMKGAAYRMERQLPV